MSSIAETFSAATKSQLEAQLQILNTLASTAVDSAEKVIALNLSTTKASVEKSSAAARQLLTITDPKEFFTLGAAQPGGFDSLLAYGRALYSIASTAQSELIQSAQSSLKQATDLATAKSAPTPPAVTAAITAAVVAANEPLATPVAKAPPKIKPVAAPIPVAEEDTFIEVKADVKPSFPAPAKAIALAPEGKPAKAAPKAKK